MSNGRVVFVKTSNWHPKQWTDLPHAGRILCRRRAATFDQCEQFQRDFNECEIAQPLGVWAMVVVAPKMHQIN